MVKGLVDVGCRFGLSGVVVIRVLHARFHHVLTRICSENVLSAGKLLGCGDMGWVFFQSGVVQERKVQCIQRHISILKILHNIVVVLGGTRDKNLLPELICLVRGSEQQIQKIDDRSSQFFLSQLLFAIHVIENLLRNLLIEDVFSGAGHHVSDTHLFYVELRGKMADFAQITHVYALRVENLF